jgi:hypothetical protein
MNRPQRERKQVERLKASNAPVQPQRKKKNDSSAAQQPVAQPPARKPRQPRRTLDLTLKQVEANMYDLGDPESEFYEKYFDNPNDAITKRLDELDYSKHTYTIFLMNGITNYELKDIDAVQLKPVSFKEFKEGKYQSDKSQSDARYTQKINKFVNQFPSFKKYSTSDDLTWIVREHRLLLCELLEYAIPRGLSLSSIESEVNAMMRIMYIALGTKQHVLYIKYSNMLQQMRADFKRMEGDNSLNTTEWQKGGLIPWPDVVKRQKELRGIYTAIANKRSKDAYALNQDLLLLSLYSLIPPLRNEPKTLEFTDVVKNEGDYIRFDGDKVILDLREVKKKHKPTMFELEGELKNIILESYNMYKREYLFTDTLKYPDMTKKASLSTMNSRLEKIFDYEARSAGQQGNYKVGASMLRSSYITWFYDKKRPTFNEKDDLAIKMRTSREMMDLHYYKKLIEPMPAVMIDEEIERTMIPAPQGVQVGKKAVPVLGPKPVLIVNKNTRPRLDDHDTYERHKERQTEYYKKNKQEILAQQKKYRQENKPLMNKRKILSYLNGSKEYKYKIRQATLNKYNIRQLPSGEYI